MSTEDSSVQVLGLEHVDSLRTLLHDIFSRRSGSTLGPKSSIISLNHSRLGKNKQTQQHSGFVILCSRRLGDSEPYSKSSVRRRRKCLGSALCCIVCTAGSFCGRPCHQYPHAQQCTQSCCTWHIALRVLASRPSEERTGKGYGHKPTER